jgi:hypothetical protein
VTAYPDPVATLQDPEVRKYFVALLNSSLPAEEKYQAFLRFFELESDLSNRLQSQGGPKPADEAMADAARKVGAWQPETILEPTRDSLERALRRIERSQHSDGGWGYEVEQSHPWATAWTVLCLHRAKSLARDGSLGRLVASPTLIERGLQWLILHRDRWSVYDAPADETRSVYETAVALRCLYRTEAADRPEVKSSVEECVACLLKNQRPEGDWDSVIWRRRPLYPSASRQEVGATSFALQALAASRRQDTTMKSSVLAGMEWLRRAQRPDGSWNASVYLPHTPVPVPSVNKTCDGLKGFLAGQRLGLDLSCYQPGIDKAVKWLLEQEQAVIGEDGKIKGWGWKDDAAGQGQTSETKTERDLLENTCLTLETLLLIESVALPLLASNALWLIRKQWRGDGGDDGKWSTDDTGRTAFALLEFYSRIKDSPIFQAGTSA